MEQSSFIGLINNAALLVALAAIYDFLLQAKLRKPLWSQLLTGILLGGITIAVMTSPWVLTPGTIFDTRSILLCTAAMFLGLIPMSVATGMAIAFRIYIGGAGALTGCLVILFSVLCGVVWRKLHNRWVKPYGLAEFYSLGIVTHTGMLLLMLTLPDSVRNAVLKSISIPVMIIYPIVTVLFGSIMSRSLIRHRQNKALHAREHHFRSLYEKAPIPYQALDENGFVITVNELWLLKMQYTKEEVVGHHFRDFIQEEDRAKLAENFIKFKDIGHIDGVEYTLLKKDNSPIMVVLNGRIVYDDDGHFKQTQCVFTDITERKQLETSLRSIEWMLTKQHVEVNPAYIFGELSTGNASKQILEAIGENVLAELVSDYLTLLDSSSVIFERNGDYAIKVRTSTWCHFLDQSSRAHCHTEDDREAMQSGKWLCHESCWSQTAKKVIDSGEPLDIACEGGIHIYGVPIKTTTETIGCICVGYGTPPVDDKKIREIATRYGLNTSVLIERAKEYQIRPKYIIEQAKRKLHTTARIIAEIVERKQTEIVLKKSEEKYRQMVETASEGIWVADNQYNTTFVNNQMLSMLGYDQTELMGRNFHDFMMKDDLEDQEQKEQGRKSGHGAKYERRFVRKDGSVIWTIVSATPRFDEKGQFEGSFAMLTDITNWKKSSLDRDRYAHRLELLRQIDRKIIESHTIGHILEAILAHVKDLIPCDRCSIIAREKDQKRWLLLANGLNGIVREEEQDLEFGPADVRDELLAGQIVHIKDLSQCSIKVTERREELISDGIVCFLHIPLIIGGEYVGTMSFSSRTANFFTEEYEEIAVELGNQLTIILHQEYLSEAISRHAADLEEKVSQRTQQLQLVNSELESFSYSVAHDLRAPLRSIDGFSNILMEDYGHCLDQEGKRYLNTIKENAKRMDVLIKELLELAKLNRNAIHYVSIDMKELVKKVINDTLEPALQDQFVIAIEAIHPIEGDQALLYQVWQNLLSNAIKFTLPCVEKQIQVGSYQQENGVVYFVRDTGVGFDERYKDKLYKVFQRLHSTKDFEGVGIGLAIVEKIVRKHLGSVWAESKIDEGSTFYFSIPNQTTII